MEWAVTTGAMMGADDQAEVTEAIGIALMATIDRVVADRPTATVDDVILALGGLSAMMAHSAGRPVSDAHSAVSIGWTTCEEHAANGIEPSESILRWRRTEGDA